MGKRRRQATISNQAPSEPFMPESQPMPVIENGLGDAIGYGNNPFGLPQGMGYPGGGSIQPISDSTTLFTNLRWYLVSNFRQLLSELFVEIGLIQTIVCVPIDDGLRGGVMIKSKQLDEEQIKKLQISMQRDNDIQTAGWAAKWNRLFGGAGIMILVDDQDPEQPLDIEAITKNTKLSFRAVDMWELFWDKQNTEGYDPEIQEEEFETYNYYAENVHKSRVMRLKGLEAPSFIRPRLRGWGVSVVETLVRSINQYLKSTDLTFEVLDEFKLDVYKIKNLVNTLLSPNGTNKIKERVQMSNWQKNYQNAIVMDSEDDFDHKQLSFAGLAEAQAGIRKQVCSDLRMPATKLFGSSESTGLGNADQNDMENYNSMVESEVRDKLRFNLLQIAELKCQNLFEFIPDDLELEFKPLRELSALDQETVKTSKFTRALQAFQAGTISIQQFQDTCNKGDLFDVKLYTIEDGMNPNDLTKESGANTDGESAQEVNDDQGANKFDSRVTDAGSTLREAKKVNNADWRESQHPRAKGGQFGEGGGGSTGKKTSGGEALDSSLEDEQKSVENSIYTLSPFDKMIRLINSAEFDRASYEADGGDSWVDPRRKEIFSNPQGIDQGLWSRAKEASHAALGEERWQFVLWFYQKHGGKFE